MVQKFRAAVKRPSEDTGIGVRLRDRGHVAHCPKYMELGSKEPNIIIITTLIDYSKHILVFAQCRSANGRKVRV